MKTRNTITRLIAITIAFAVLLAAGLLQPVEAQIGDGSVRFVSYGSVGIVPGEKLRLSVANTSSGTSSLSFSYYLAHGTNSASAPLYESEWIQVPPGEFRVADVAHKDLKTEGELGTERAQVIVKVNMVAPAGSNAEDFPTSLELLRDEVETVQTDSRYRLIILAAKRSKQLAPSGFIPGQTLRYTFFNSNEEGTTPIRVRAYVYDSYGNLLTQTDSVELRPSESHTFEVNRDDLRLAGEKKTGRLQVRAALEAIPVDVSVRYANIRVFTELLDRQTGTTLEHNYVYYTGTVSVSGDGE